MNVKFDKIFSKDLKKLKNRDLDFKIKQTIAECKAALNLSEINQNLKVIKITIELELEIIALAWKYGRIR